MRKIIDKLGLVSIQKGQLLVARSKGKDIFYIPGGKREPGETDQEALTRECQEELSVTLHQDSMVKLGEFEAPAHGKSEDTIVRVMAYTANFTEKLRANTEIEELAWFSYDNLNRCSLATQKIMQHLHEQGLLISQVDVKKP